MNGKKIRKVIKTGVIILISLVAIAVLLHLTVNYLIPFISNMHHNSGVY